MARFFLIAAAFVYSFSLFGQKVDVQQLKGMNIRNIGPAGMSGRVTSIDVDLSKPQHIYVGTASGGVWKSTSGGMTWDPIFDKQPLQSIGAVCGPREHTTHSLPSPQDFIGALGYLLMVTLKVGPASTKNPWALFQSHTGSYCTAKTCDTVGGRSNEQAR